MKAATFIETATRQAILRTDAFMRSRLGIEECADGEQNVLRLSRRINGGDLRFSDGTWVRKGERIGELHLWNEHLVRLRRNEGGVAWALKAAHAANTSLRALTTYIEREPSWRAVQAFRADAAFLSRHGSARLPRILARYGFEIPRGPESTHLGARLRSLLPTLYTICLMWAFNPASVSAKQVLHFERQQFWITRRTLLSKYAPASRRPGIPTSDRAVA